MDYMTVMSLARKRIVVGVSGGIAAYKAVELVRELGRAGAQVRVVMTPSATRFVGAITFTGITGKPAIVDLWDPSYAGEVHVELGAWADGMVLAPATANLLARAAAGMSDDAVLATLRCIEGPILFAPAMHHRMWKAPSLQRAVTALKGEGANFVGPVHGKLASGEEGMGRMSEPAQIAAAFAALFTQTRDLTGKTVLVSAGPTQEDVDPVRYLSNRSTGRMGYAIAERAVRRGARVILVSGPVSIDPPQGVELVKVRSASEMHAAIMACQSEVDAIVMTAAVADYRPAALHTQKIKKSDTLTLDLVKNPDILAELGEGRSGTKPVLVGFALETNDVVAYARDKLTRKKVDLVVANHADDGLGGDTNVATLVHADGDDALGKLPKSELADRIWDWIAARV